MLDVEQAIAEVGAVYRALTGRPIEAGRTELPPEIDARVHIEGRYRELRSMLDAPAHAAAAPSAPPWTPSLEVIEQDLAVRFDLDLPAVPRDQIGVSVLGDALVVRGQRNHASPRGVVRFSERPMGSIFARTIPLPPRARRDGITAALRDGVLSILVPTDGPGGAPQAIEIR